MCCLSVCLSDAERIWPGSRCHLHRLEDELGVWIAKYLKLGWEERRLSYTSEWRKDEGIKLRMSFTVLELGTLAALVSHEGMSWRNCMEARSPSTPR